MKKFTLTSLLFSLLGILMGLTANAQSNFGSNNLAILVAAASANNTTVSVVEIDTNTLNQSAIQTITIPGTGPNAIRVSGSATSTLYAANSKDTTLFIFTGHNNATTNVNANTLNPRAVVTINNTGAINIATTYTGASGNQTRCATTFDNIAYYIADQGGMYTNNTTSPSPSGNFRAVRIFGDSVYVGRSSNTTSIVEVATLSAITGGVVTPLPGLTNNNNHQDFYLVSSGANGSDYDILYILRASSNAAGTIEKYSLVNGTWLTNGTYSTTYGGFGLFAHKRQIDFALYVTTGTGASTANSVRKLVDISGYNQTLNITSDIVLYTTPAGTIIKGIGMAPKPGFTPPPTPTTFYNKPTGDFNQLSTWGTNPDGTGTAPTNFTDANQTFIIANGASHTHTGSWTVSGAGSKIVVGDGTNAILVNIIGSISAPLMDVRNNAQVDLYTQNIPPFGTLEPNSTVGYLGNMSVVPATYGNLIFIGTGIRTLPDANFTIQGRWTLSGDVQTAATTFRTITFNGDSIKLNAGANMQPGAGNANTTQRNTNIEFNTSTNQVIWSQNATDSLRIGRLISTKSSGSLTLNAHVALYNRIILNYTGSATFNDGGRYILVGDNIEAQGLASAYNLTGTFELRRLDGSTSNQNIRRDGANNDNPAVCEFNNLIINSPNAVNFRPTNSTAATYTIKGNLSILSSANLVDLGTNNTIDVQGNMTNTSDTLIVYPGGRLKVDGTLTNTGVIELRASAANGAALLRANGNIPNVRVSQHIEGTAGTGKWIHTRMPVDAPLNSVISQQNAIMFIDNNTGSVYSWNAGTAQYDAPASATTSFTATPGWVLYVGENTNGTFVSTLPATLTTAAGTTTDQSSNVQVALPYNDGQSSPFLTGPVTATQGWNLVANPWPMVFDIAEGELNGSASFGIHVYRNGAYDAYHHVNNTGNAALRFLPLGQAFWVQRASTPATQNFTFKTAGRQFANSTNLAKHQALPGEYHFTLRSVNQANGNTIKTYLSARDNAGDQFIMHEDVVARRNENGFHQFYSYQNNVGLAINTQSKLLNGTRTIPLYFEHGEQGTFRIEAIESGEQDEMYSVVLEDRHTNTFTDLYKASYTFQHNPNIEVNRFMLHINASSIGQEERAAEKSNLWTSNGNIFIQSLDNVPVALEIIDITGRNVYNSRLQLATGINVISAPTLARGVYVIRMTAGGQTTVVKTVF